MLNGRKSERVRVMGGMERPIGLKKALGAMTQENEGKESESVHRGLGSAPRTEYAPRS